MAAITRMTPLVPVQSCCQKVVSSIGSTWDTIWEKGGLAIHAITWIFFRVISAFAPAAVFVEVTFVHTVAIICGMRGRSKVKELKSELIPLRKKHAKLEAAHRQMTRAAIRTTITMDQLRAEAGQAEDERNRARTERDASVSGRAALQRDRDSYKQLATELQQRLNDAIAAKQELEQTHSRAVTESQVLAQTAANLQRQLSQSDSYQHLGEHLTQIKAAYQAQQNNPTIQQHNRITAQLEQLIPAYEQNKAEFRAQLEQCKMDNPNNLPLQVAIQGIIELSIRESGLFPGMLMTMQFHKDLQASCFRMCQLMQQQQPLLE